MVCVSISSTHMFTGSHFPPILLFWIFFTCYSFIRIPYYSCCIVKRLKIVSHLLLLIISTSCCTFRLRNSQLTTLIAGVSPGQEAFGGIGFSDTQVVLFYHGILTDTCSCQIKGNLHRDGLIIYYSIKTLQSNNTAL